MPKSIVINDSSFSWTGETSSRTSPMKDSVAYEVHLRGFTAQDTSLSVDDPRHLRRLQGQGRLLEGPGVTAVELLPIHEYPQFDDPVGGATADRVNYWGYMTTQFFAPNREYLCTANTSCTYVAGQQVNEFKEMVKALHAAGDRGVARRGLQPHLRGRRLRGQPGALHQPARPRQRHLLHPGRRQDLLLGFDRHRQQPERQPPGRCAS